MRNPELRETIVSAMNGSCLAMEKLFETYHKKVYYEAYAIVMDPHLANDVVQETFIAIRHLHPRNAPVKNAESWLISVARNTAYSLRRKQNRNDPVIPFPLPGEYTSNDANFETGALIPLADDMLNELNLRIDLYRALSALSELERRVVFLRLGELKHYEIAKIIGQNASTVRNIYTRALAKLRVLLSSEVE